MWTNGQPKKKGSAQGAETYINPPSKKLERSVKIRLLYILLLNKQEIYNYVVLPLLQPTHSDVSSSGI
jgi:hypothetical protein